MDNADYLTNPELKKHLESKAYRHASNDDASEVDCEACNEELLTGDKVFVVSWTPPAHSVADSATVDRNFHRYEVYCPSHEDAALNSFDELVNREQNFDESDIVLFSSNLTNKYGEIRFSGIRFINRNTPSSWE
jgi:hypothetical protein